MAGPAHRTAHPERPRERTRIPSPRRDGPGVGHGLVRRRLVDALEAPPDVRMCLLLGPQGSGKTTALAHWAATTRTSTAAVSTSPADGEDECRRVVGDAVARGASVLVLDDADRQPACVRVLQEVVRDVPRVRLVLAGRSLPLVDLARDELRARVVQPDVLRFREHEVSALFRDHYDTPLSALDAARLTRHTDGWAAGLQLFGTSVEGLTPAECATAVSSLTGRVRFARHYLHHQALAGLPTPVQVLLRDTSPLERLTADRCRALLGRDVAQDLLGLEGCSLVGSPDAGVTWLVHPLLRAHLLTELREVEGDTEVDRRLQHSARLHALHGEVAEAARTLVRAHAWPELDELLRTSGARVCTAGDVGWLEDLPDAVVRRSVPLRLGRALHRLRDGRLSSALDDARAVVDCTAGAEVELQATAAAIASSARTWLEGSPRPVTGSSLLRAALEQPHEVARSTLTGMARHEPGAVLGATLAHLLRGDVEAARVVARTGASEDELLGLVSRILFAGVEAPGWGQLDRLSRQARVGGWPWLARAVDLLEAARPYAHGVPAHDTLHRRVRECDDAADPWGAALACALRAMGLLLARTPDVAAFEELCARLRALHAPALEAWARAGLAVASAMAQLPDADRDAEAAAAFAVACQLPAVQAVAHLAAAASRDEGAAELRVLARAEAGSAGFDLDPWTGLLEPEDGARRIHESVPPLVVRCFGHFELSVRGVVPPLHQIRPRAREVLRLLAVQGGRPLHREFLLDALWPDLDAVAATHNLHVAVSSLRGLLEPGAVRGASSLVVRRGSHYLLAHPPGTVCDLTEFDLALSEASVRSAAGDPAGACAALTRALDGYRGDVLGEDGPAEWLVPIRDHYRLRAGEAAGDLAEALLELGDHQGAAAAARRSTELSPWRDASWRALQVACRRAGDPAAAERARADYRRVLAGLGVGPAGDDQRRFPVRVPPR